VIAAIHCLLSKERSVRRHARLLGREPLGPRLGALVDQRLGLRLVGAAVLAEDAFQRLGFVALQPGHHVLRVLGVLRRQADGIVAPIDLHFGLELVILGLPLVALALGGLAQLLLLLQLALLALAPAALRADQSLQVVTGVQTEFLQQPLHRLALGALEALFQRRLADLVERLLTLLVDLRIGMTIRIGRGLAGRRRRGCTRALVRRPIDATQRALQHALLSHHSQGLTAPRQRCAGVVRPPPGAAHRGLTAPWKRLR